MCASYIGLKVVHNYITFVIYKTPSGLVLPQDSLNLRLLIDIYVVQTVLQGQLQPEFIMGL